MSHLKPFHLDFNDFPIIINKAIVLPANTMLFRGYHADSNPVSNEPTHFGTIDLALSYSEQPSHKLGFFVPSKGLRLLDLRFIIILLREMFNRPVGNVNIVALRSLLISYGLCSLAAQLRELEIMVSGDYESMMTEYTQLNTYYKKYESDRESNILAKNINTNINVFEPQGIRLGITTIDSLSILTLKTLLAQYDIDGFISPQLFSPFHFQNRNREEIVIFDPKSSGLVLVGEDKYTIDKLLRQDHRNIVDFCDLNQIIDFPNVFYSKFNGLQNGGETEIEIEFNPEFDKNVDPNIIVDMYLLGNKNVVEFIDNHKKLIEKEFYRLDIKIGGLKKRLNFSNCSSKHMLTPPSDYKIIKADKIVGGKSILSMNPIIYSD
jgi:hypothetical protein